MPFYMLLNVLHVESVQVETTVELVWHNKLSRKQETKYKNINDALFQAWEEFRDVLHKPDQLFDKVTKLH